MIRWRYITGDGDSASYGQAADEFLMNNYASWLAGDCPEPTLRLYTFKPHVVLVGRFQNLEAEVNVEECDNLGIEIGRRVTGGGAILMGDRQLAVALASSADHPAVPSHPMRIFPKLTRGIVCGLEELGIKAEFRSKNDIVVNGRKIAGTAICIEGSGALLFHVSLLVDFDTSLMLRVLRTPFEKISDKGIASYEERLTTICRELDRDVTAEEAREAICRGFERAFKIRAEHNPFTADELGQIDKLEREKHLTPDWSHLRQPTPDMLGSSIRKTPAGLLRAYVSLTGDVVKNVLLTGDFFSFDRTVTGIEAALKWGRADRDSIMRTVRVGMTMGDSPILGLEPAELAETIWEAVEDARSKSATSTGGHATR